MSASQVHKCRLCGALYQAHRFLVGDQSVCPKCRAAARRNTDQALRDFRRPRYGSLPSRPAARQYGLLNDLFGNPITESIGNGLHRHTFRLKAK